MTGEAELSIWQFTSSTAWGGRESVPVKVYHELCRRGLANRLFCAQGSAIAQRYGDQPGVDALKLGGLLNAQARLKLAKLLSEAAPPPRAVVCHYSHDLFLLRRALAKHPETKLLLVKHIGPGRDQKDLVHRWLYRRVDLLLGVSNFIADLCRAHLPLDPQRVDTWYPGVDLEKFQFNSAQRTVIRQQLGLTDQEILIGYVARLTPQKGHAELIEAFLNLARQRENIYLVLLGSASPEESHLEQELKRMAANQAGERRIIWPGFKENVGDWLSACDIFAQPAHEEAFGLNTVEAMACGRAIVGTTGGATPELIADGETGLLVPPHDPRLLTNALGGLLDNRALRERLGRASQAAASRFGWPAAVDRLLQLID